MANTEHGKKVGFFAKLANALHDAVDTVTGKKAKKAKEAAKGTATDHANEQAQANSNVHSALQRSVFPGRNNQVPSTPGANTADSANTHHYWK